MTLEEQYAADMSDAVKTLDSFISRHSDGTLVLRPVGAMLEVREDIFASLIRSLGRTNEMILSGELKPEDIEC